MQNLLVYRFRDRIGNEMMGVKFSSVQMVVEAKKNGYTDIVPVASIPYLYRDGDTANNRNRPIGPQRAVRNRGKR
jgi:hypothetical protein